MGIDVRAFLQRHKLVTGIVVLIVAIKLLFGVLLPLIGIQAAVPQSASMKPTIHPGDFVVVSNTPFENIAEGDIVMYTASNVNQPIVHRVTAKNSSALETQGDNNLQQLPGEKYVTADQTVGTATVIIPKAGYVLRPDTLLLH